MPESSSRRERDPAVTRLVFAQFAVLLLVSSWAFGGQSPFARDFIAAWSAIGVALFFWISWQQGRRDGRLPAAIRLLWPLWLYDVLVITSCFNPGFREILVSGQPSLVLGDPHPWLPSAAIPRFAARELWQFNGLLLSAFNLWLVCRRRGQLRAILLLLAGNAVVLAIFGTFQKLVGASGLWFGLVKSPNTHFFATFIYHNHWGAFTLLNFAAALALLFHYHRHHDHRDFWHSPVMLGALGATLLALSIPLSTSRSCTVLVAFLSVGALAHFLRRIIRDRRAAGQSAAGPVAAIVLAALLAVGATAYLGRDIIAQRSRLTSQQLSKLSAEGTLTSRAVLYRDTWRMAEAKPWFGWGLESYSRVFRIFNTQRAAETWVWIPFYAEAHNDWLQSLAETGFVGTGLLVTLGVLPFFTVRWSRVRSAVPRYLLAGCGLILAYAWLEFPLANPVVVLTFCTCFYAGLRYAQLDAQHE